MLVLSHIQDSTDQARICKKLLSRSSFKLMQIAHHTLNIISDQQYVYENEVIDLSAHLQKNLQSKRFIPPEELLKLPMHPHIDKSRIFVRNETTLMAARRFAEQDKKALVLNFANGTNVGGGFRLGARAQEETLCYASSLYQTLKGDHFYKYHRFKRIVASEYAIVSHVIVFRDDQYQLIEKPWQMDVVTSAAPIAIHGFGVSKKKGAALMDTRIERIYEIAASLGYQHLVLGAWGCGAFGNDPYAIAQLFRKHLEGRFQGWFADVSFAIADWSQNRKFLRPFADTLCL
jgi:uncharacterized protein (TIGR02452 family)